MKILVVTQYFWPENFKINDICLGLKKRGHEVHVLTGLPNVPDGKYHNGYSFWKKGGAKEYNGIKLNRIRIFQRHNNFINLAFNCLSFALFGITHVPKLIKEKYDLIFVYQVSPVTSIVPARWLKMFKNIPMVTYVLDIWPESMYFLINKEKVPNFIDKICRGYSKNLYHAADKILISSSCMEQKLLDMKIEKENIKWFPNTADKLEIKPYNKDLANKYNLENKFVITFAGNIGRAQGLELILKAAESLKDNEDIIWLIIGNGTEKNKLELIAKEKNINDKIIFTGWQEKDILSDFFSISSALIVILKNNEVLNMTVPAKVQTYLTSKKPILISANGEAAKVISESNSGLVSEADDLETLVENIKILYNMEENQRNKLGENGILYYNQNYNSEKLYDELSEYLEEFKNKYNKK